MAQRADLPTAEGDREIKAAVANGLNPLGPFLTPRNPALNILAAHVRAAQTNPAVASVPVAELRAQSEEAEDGAYLSTRPNETLAPSIEILGPLAEAPGGELELPSSRPRVTYGEEFGPPVPAPIGDATLSQIQINAQNGTEFQARANLYGADTLGDFQKEVSVRPFTNADRDNANFRIRLDGLGIDPDTSNFAGLEAKGSETAPLTPNQTKGIPLLEQYGGAVVGNGGNPFYPAGTVLTPTPVQIIRPSSLPRGY